jgi:hypothetical protein
LRLCEELSLNQVGGRDRFAARGEFLLSQMDYLSKRRHEFLMRTFLPGLLFPQDRRQRSLSRSPLLGLGVLRFMTLECRECVTRLLPFWPKSCHTYRTLGAVL